MIEFTTDQRVIISIAILSFSAILGVAHVVRSIKLKFPIEEPLIKMYITFFVVAILAILAISGAITGDAVIALLGSIVGYVLGSRSGEKKE